MKRWRVFIEQVNADVVEVPAENEAEAVKKASEIWKQNNVIEISTVEDISEE